MNQSIFKLMLRCSWRRPHNQVWHCDLYLSFRLLCHFTAFVWRCPRCNKT